VGRKKERKDSRKLILLLQEIKDKEGGRKTKSKKGGERSYVAQKGNGNEFGRQ